MSRTELRKNTTAVSSDEEEDFTQLQTVEQKLLTHDPTFGIEQTHSALSSQRSAFMSAFRPQYVDGDVEGSASHIAFLDRRAIEALITGRARIHLSIERWRVCETWFAPSMAGVDSAGLGEVLQNVLASFSHSDRSLLVQVLTSIPPFPSLPLFPLVAFSILTMLLSRPDAERVPNGYAGADARALGPPSRDAAADPPARDATPDRVCGEPVPRCMAGNGRVRTDGGICACWRD